MNRIITLAACLFVAGCSLENGSAPAVTGPSELALSVTLSASPDQLPRDGSSVSTITVTVRDAAGQPVVGQRLTVSSSLGSVSSDNIVTGANGQTSFTFVAPGSGSVGNVAVIRVVPISTDAANAAARTVNIQLTGTSNSTRPTPAFTFTPAAPQINQAVRFDASTTTDESAVCSDACAYSWNFGDGSTGSGRIVSHTYTGARTYVVSLTVTDAGASSASTAQSVTVANVLPPTVTLAVSPSPPLANEPATFTATATPATGHSIVRYAWSFGDGNTSTTTGPTVTRTYTAIGTYVATVTVTDDIGQTASATTSFTITGAGVTASFTISPTAALTNQTVQFNGSASTGSAGATISTWAWDFGDGSTSSESDATTSHAYSSVGTFVIRLTVTDSNSRTGTTTGTVAVTAP